MLWHVRTLPQDQIRAYNMCYKTRQRLQPRSRTTEGKSSQEEEEKNLRLHQFHNMLYTPSFSTSSFMSPPSHLFHSSSSAVLGSYMSGVISGARSSASSWPRGTSFRGLLDRVLKAMRLSSRGWRVRKSMKEWLLPWHQDFHHSKKNPTPEVSESFHYSCYSVASLCKYTVAMLLHTHPTLLSLPTACHQPEAAPQPCFFITPHPCTVQQYFSQYKVALLFTSELPCVFIAFWPGTELYLTVKNNENEKLVCRFWDKKWEVCH